jgi:hypothetical protein
VAVVFSEAVVGNEGARVFVGVLVDPSARVYPNRGGVVRKRVGFDDWRGNGSGLGSLSDEGRVIAWRRRCFGDRGFSRVGADARRGARCDFWGKTRSTGCCLFGQRVYAKGAVLGLLRHGTDLRGTKIVVRVFDVEGR